MFYVKHRRTDYQFGQTNVLDRRNEERYAQNKGEIRLPKGVAATLELRGGICREPGVTSGAGEHRTNGQECCASQDGMIAVEFGSIVCAQKLPAFAARLFEN
jgi:hypothetical protein